MSVCEYVCVLSYVCVSMYVCVCVCMCVYMCMCVCVYVFVLAFICVCQLLYHLTQKHFDDQAKIIQTNIYNSTNMPTQTNQHTKQTNPKQFW